MVGISFKGIVLGLCNLEISGLHTYTRGEPFWLPILC